MGYRIAVIAALLIATVRAQAPAELVRPIDSLAIGHLRATGPGHEDVDDVLLSRLAHGRFLFADGTPTDAFSAIEEYLRTPVSIRISTPYSRACQIFREARQDSRSVALPPLEDLNRDGVVVTIAAGYDLRLAARVNRMFVRHNGQVFAPLTTSVKSFDHSDLESHRERRAIAEEAILLARLTEAKRNGATGEPDLSAAKRNEHQVSASMTAPHTATSAFALSAFAEEPIELVIVLGDGREYSIVLDGSDIPIG
jgi:hypothetical protein